MIYTKHSVEHFLKVINHMINEDFQCVDINDQLWRDELHDITYSFTLLMDLRDLLKSSTIDWECIGVRLDVCDKYSMHYEFIEDKCLNEIYYILTKILWRRRHTIDRIQVYRKRYGM